MEPAARAVLARRWPGAGAVDVSVDSAGRGDHHAGWTAAGTRRRAASCGPAGTCPRSPPRRAERHAGGRDWEVEGTGFWQVHPAAADALVAAVAGFAEVAAGGDGAGPLRRRRAVRRRAGARGAGRAGRVVCVEADAAACAAADANLADLPQAEVWQGEVDAEGLAGLLAELGDGARRRRPRPAAGRCGAGGEPRCSPATGARAVVYVACDPAALARDVAAFAAAGYRLAALRAFDAFPMTAHVECVALLVPATACSPCASGHRIPG